MFEYDANGSFVSTLPSVATPTTNGEWRKGYIYLNDELINTPAGSKFRVYFRGINGDNSFRAEVFFDNFKLMYRE